MLNISLAERSTGPSSMKFCLTITTRPACANAAEVLKPRTAMTVRIDFEIPFLFENIRSSLITLPSLRIKAHHCDARLKCLDICYQSITSDPVLNVRHIVSGALLVNIANVA